MPSLSIACAIRFFALILMFVSCATNAMAQVGTVIPSGSTATVDTHTVCMQVTNPGSGNRVVFTGTAAEWLNFRTNLNGLTMTPCPPACSGVSVAGYCWYRGGVQESCDTTCSSHGGVNMNGTRDYVGSGGTLSQCRSVANAINAVAGLEGYSGDGPDYGGAEAVGCSILRLDMWGSISHTAGRFADSTTTSSATREGVLRICACNN